MNDREKQILKILRRNPLIQQNEIADILQISRSRVAAHIMDLMRKGLIKGKGYILTEQDYCVVVGAINMDIRGMADIRYPQAASHPVLFTVPQAASDVISRITWLCLVGMCI